MQCRYLQAKCSGQIWGQAKPKVVIVGEVIEFSLLQNVRTVSGGPTSLLFSYRVFFYEVKLPGREAVHFYLVARLRMSGDIPSFP